MGWSEQDEQLAQEIQARVDAETSALKEQVATLTKALKYEKMNTAVWQQDAKKKLDDRTYAYHELAAAQAQIVQLREALKVVEDGIDDCWAVNCPAEMNVFRAAIAIPTDDTALRERLAQERERCAKELEEIADLYSPEDCAAAIRSMK